MRILTAIAVLTITFTGWSVPVGVIELDAIQLGGLFDCLTTATGRLLSIYVLRVRIPIAQITTRMCQDREWHHEPREDQYQQQDGSQISGSHTQIYRHKSIVMQLITPRYAEEHEMNLLAY